MPIDDLDVLYETVEVLKKEIDQNNTASARIVICPPFTLLSSLSSIADKGLPFIGAQNVHSKSSGAYTGEISVEMLKEWNVSFCIVGHSERRFYFSEADNFLFDKVEILLSNKIQPIFCVGETLEERNKGLHEKVILRQIDIGLGKLSKEQFDKCLIAYEPVWAIGTGETATPKQANHMHQVIRSKVRSLQPDVANKLMILYGGSVNGSNAEELLSQSDIDGALVGGASLKTVDFCKIIRAGNRL